MRQITKVEGTKIAQAAKDLNVTSVTIRRYIAEFNIPTIPDENGIKVLPSEAMDELQEIRRLKEDGLSNAKVSEMLEEQRTKMPPANDKSKAKTKIKGEEAERAPASRATKKVNDEEKDSALSDETVTVKPTGKHAANKSNVEAGVQEENDDPVLESEPAAAAAESESDEPEAAGDDNRSKHSLTCQTCGKVFEHMNPRLRDCLDCYRTKRRERRRGSSDRHKNVIQHPLAQQVMSKTRDPIRPEAPIPVAAAALGPVPHTNNHVAVAPVVQHKGPVRNYRKAIEETRQVTGSLKRRLERPDLAEGERRWLEQIYAYQLILHQGWRHLAEYKAGGTTQTQPSLAEE